MIHTINKIKKWIFLSAFSACIVILCSACSHQTAWDETSADPTRTTIYLSFETGTMLSRAGTINENTIQELDVLVFKNGLYSNRVTTQLKDGIAHLSLKQSEDPISLYLLANVRNILDATSIESNSTEAEVAQQITMAYQETGLGEYIPMSGSYTFNKLTGGDTEEITVKMLRSVASVIVQLTDSPEVTAKFRLTSACIYRANNRFQIIPNANTLISENNTLKVHAPSISSTTQNNIMTTLSSEVVGNRITGIYFPEANEQTTEETQISEATCLIIGGIYEDSDRETFYRIDFKNKNGDKFGEILRNHRYRITIKNVSGIGEPTPGEAGEKKAINIVIEIVDWEENEDTNLIYDQQGNYIGIPTIIRLPYFTTASKNVNVLTNLDDFTIQWLDESGALTGSPQSKGEGETENDLFYASIPTTGNNIVFTAKSDNSTGKDRSRKLIVRAGSIQIPITVIQEPSDANMGSNVKVFSYTGLLGNLGDDVMSPIPGGDGASASVLRDLFKNTTYFGPDGKVPFGGFSLAGLPYQTSMSVQLAELFDVILIPNQAPLRTGEAEILTHWLSASPRHILMTYINNSDLIAQLGNNERAITLNPDPTNQKLRIAEDAPVNILRGPFGIATNNFSFVTPLNAFVHILDRNDPGNSQVEPILVNDTHPNEIVIGIDKTRRIVYLANPYFFDGSMDVFSGNGQVNTSKQADVILANLITWIAETATGEDLAPNIPRL